MKRALLLKKMMVGGFKLRVQPRPLTTGRKLSTAGGRQPAVLSDIREPAVDLLVESLPTESLPTVMSSLTRFVEESEADFMLLGIGLRSVYSNVTELTDLMLGTVRQINAEEEGGFLEQGRQVLKASLAEIRAYHDGVRADLEHINTVLADLENLSTTSKQIKQFAKSLKTVALIMLVENGRTNDGSVSFFSEVAQEIKELSVNITAIANDVHKNVEKARKMHRVSREEIAARIKRLETLTTAIESTVQASAHDTEMLMQLSVDAVEQAGRRSRDISRQVAEIVVGVQFHDNMKQRMTHIIADLKAIADSAGETAPTKAADETETRMPAGLIVRDQIARLKEINNDVNDVFQKNRTALQAIENETATLLQGLQGMAADSRLDGSISLMQDPFSHLKNTLTQLHSLLDRGKVLYEQIQKTADHVSGITSELSQLLNVVRGISSHTHNKAINAIIAAGRQGEKGGAMKLLAQEMNGLASQSDVFTREVEEIITSITNLTVDIGRRDINHSPDMDNAGGAISRVNEVLNDIALGYESFRKDSIAAFERAGGLKKAIDTTFSGLDFFQGLARRIEEYGRQLMMIAGQPGMDKLMVAVDRTADARLPHQDPAGREDNVILFEKVRKSQADTSGHEAFDHALGDNVELF